MGRPAPDNPANPSNPPPSNPNNPGAFRIPLLILHNPLILENPTNRLSVHRHKLRLHSEHRHKRRFHNRLQAVGKGRLNRRHSLLRLPHSPLLPLHNMGSY